jgi:hypothetical protein
VAERRHPADGESRRLANLVAVRLADALAELGGVDAPVAGAEAEQRPVAVHEDERLDDLAELGADGVGRLLRGSGRLGQLADLDVEPEVVEALLESLGGRVQSRRLVQPCRS